MSDTLDAIGWTAETLQARLRVRADTVRTWLSGRRPVPDNLARWLIAVREGVASAGELPEGWNLVPSRRKSD